MRLRDDLLRRAKKRAADEGRTLTSMIEEGLTIVLSRTRRDSKRGRHPIPVSKAKGGVLPGVDLNKSGEIWDILDGP